MILIKNLLFPQKLNLNAQYKFNALKLRKKKNVRQWSKWQSVQLHTIHYYTLLVWILYGKRMSLKNARDSSKDTDGNFPISQSHEKFLKLSETASTHQQDSKFFSY